MKLGFIGLGIMGKPMAINLLKAKDDPTSELLVADLNKEAVAAVVKAGAREASYAEIGRECSIIKIVCENIPVLHSIAILIGSGESVRKLPDVKAPEVSEVVETVKKKIAETAKRVHLPKGRKDGAK